MNKFPSLGTPSDRQTSLFPAARRTSETDAVKSRSRPYRPPTAPSRTQSKPLRTSLPAVPAAKQTARASSLSEPLSRAALTTQAPASSEAAYNARGYRVRSYNDRHGGGAVATSPPDTVGPASYLGYWHVTYVGVDGVPRFTTKVSPPADHDQAVPAYHHLEITRAIEGNAKLYGFKLQYLYVMEEKSGKFVPLTPHSAHFCRTFRFYGVADDMERAGAETNSTPAAPTDAGTPRDLSVDPASAAASRPVIAAPPRLTTAAADEALRGPFLPTPRRRSLVEEPAHEAPTANDLPTNAATAVTADALPNLPPPCTTEPCESPAAVVTPSERRASGTPSRAALHAAKPLFPTEDVNSEADASGYVDSPNSEPRYPTNRRRRRSSSGRAATASDLLKAQSPMKALYAEEEEAPLHRTALHFAIGMAGAPIRPSEAALTDALLGDVCECVETTPERIHLLGSNHDDRFQFLYSHDGFHSDAALQARLDGFPYPRVCALFLVPIDEAEVHTPTPASDSAPKTRAVDPPFSVPVHALASSSSDPATTSEASLGFVDLAEPTDMPTVVRDLVTETTSDFEELEPPVDSAREARNLEREIPVRVKAEDELAPRLVAVGTPELPSQVLEHLPVANTTATEARALVDETSAPFEELTSSPEAVKKARVLEDMDIAQPLVAATEAKPQAVTPPCSAARGAPTSTSKPAMKPATKPVPKSAPTTTAPAVQPSEPAASSQPRLVAAGTPELPSQVFEPLADDGKAGSKVRDLQDELTPAFEELKPSLAAATEALNLEREIPVRVKAEDELAPRLVAVGTPELPSQVLEHLPVANTTATEARALVDATSAPFEELTPSAGDEKKAHAFEENEIARPLQAASEAPRVVPAPIPPHAPAAPSPTVRRISRSISDYDDDDLFIAVSEYRSPTLVSPVKGPRSRPSTPPTSSFEVPPSRLFPTEAASPHSTDDSDLLQDASSPKPPPARRQTLSPAVAELVVPTRKDPVKYPREPAHLIVHDVEAKSTPPRTVGESRSSSTTSSDAERDKDVVWVSTPDRVTRSQRSSRSTSPHHSRSAVSPRNIYASGSGNSPMRAAAENYQGLPLTRREQYPTEEAGRAEITADETPDVPIVYKLNGPSHRTSQPIPSLRRAVNSSSLTTSQPRDTPTPTRPPLAPRSKTAREPLPTPTPTRVPATASSLLDEDEEDDLMASVHSSEPRRTVRPLARSARTSPVDSALMHTRPGSASRLAPHPPAGPRRTPMSTWDRYGDEL